ncbi:hypothetical protein [Nesterenkonia pannonica]|uniref:hypothetical protein n=1 Tax=Nesterenkonia pannonica TaxID=1548602 RepID=UPI00216480D4|nr:hypothetical protein [Nesterenkonia pannonica]
MAAIGGAAFFLYSYMLTLQLHEFTVSNLTTLLMAVLVGACLGFLPHNFHPSSVIMGDTGAMLLGTVMAAGALVVTSSLELYEESFRFMNVLTYMPVLLPLAVMVLPMLDLVMAVARRTARGIALLPRSGPPPSQASGRWVLASPSSAAPVYVGGDRGLRGVSFNFIPWQWVVLSAGGGLTAAAVLTFTPRFRRLIRRKGAP